MNFDSKPIQASRDARRLECELGATAVEYAILCSMIAGVVVGTVTILGITIKGLFDTATW